MLLVVGFPLRWQIPVWRRDSPLHVRGIDSVMISYREVAATPAVRDACLQVGLREYFRVPGQAFLDNGAFAAARAGEGPDVAGYVAFVRQARPQWYPIPFDYMPLPHHPARLRAELRRRTQLMNVAYSGDGYVPVVHAGPGLEKCVRRLMERVQLKSLAIGGLVPYLRHAAGTARSDLLGALGRIRTYYRGRLHIFGIGGPTSLCIAAAIGADSCDSSGWQVRAFNGVILFPRRAGRFASRLSRWRTVDRRAKAALRECSCSACHLYGSSGLLKTGPTGFRHRAVHNLTMLANARRLIEAHLDRGDFRQWALREYGRGPFASLVREAVETL